MGWRRCVQYYFPIFMCQYVSAREVQCIVLIGARNFHIKFGSCNKPYTSFNGISTKGEHVVQDPIIVVASCIGQY
jgi:hypothetical protein